MRSAVKATTANCNGENPRGVLIYAYCHTDASLEANRISALYKNLDISSNPVIILFLDDSEGEVLSALTVKKALQKFSLADKKRFKKHIADQQRSQNNKIIRKFTKCVARRSMVGNSWPRIVYHKNQWSLYTMLYASVYKGCSFCV